jgi:hypothetical protein
VCGATYLTVMLEPFRSDLGDGVILVLGSSGNAGEAGGRALAHGGKEFSIYIFLQIGGLFYI